MEISLIDRNIRHIPSFNGYTEPKNITWCRDGVQRNITVFTDKFVHKAYSHYLEGIKIAWLMEPKAVYQGGYNMISKQQPVKYTMGYDYIMSHNINFLRQFPEKQRVFCPGSGSSLYEYEWKIYPKTKSILTVVGNKNTTEGHKFRHEVVEKFGDQIDVIGRSCAPFPPEKRAEMYAPYRFQIVVHNSAVEDYWTDILLDCFLTGTIPIVWKGDFLKKYFNEQGYFTFKKLRSLGFIISDLNSHGNLIYENCLLAVEDNFERAKKLAVVEDYLYDNFFKNLLG
jgi:hypothetical protein